MKRKVNQKLIVQPTHTPEPVMHWDIYTSCLKKYLCKGVTCSCDYNTAQKVLKQLPDLTRHVTGMLTDHGFGSLLCAKLKNVVHSWVNTYAQPCSPGTVAPCCP